MGGPVERGLEVAPGQGREFATAGLMDMVAVRPRPDLALLMFSGEIDLSTSEDLGSWVEAPREATVVVDLTCVGFLAARAARRLGTAGEAVRARGGRLRVVVSGPVMARMLRLVGDLALHDSVVDACR
jgi:anti-anti-sigma factor